jgi:hypothetical protein
MEQALRRTAESYRRAIWDDQPAYVEVWCEKEALAGIIIEETAPYDVPLMVTREYGSITYLHSAAQAYSWLSDEKPVFGDHDPSGLDIERNVERRLREFSRHPDLHFKRIAVTRHQIVDLRLQTRPTKQSDSRARNFRGRSVELDAIPAATLRGLVRDCIEQHIDRRVLRVLEATERMERGVLEQLAANGLGK